MLRLKLIHISKRGPWDLSTDTGQSYFLVPLKPSWMMRILDHMNESRADSITSTTQMITVPVVLKYTSQLYTRLWFGLVMLIFVWRDLWFYSSILFQVASLSLGQSYSCSSDNQTILTNMSVMFPLRIWMRYSRYCFGVICVIWCNRK